MQLPIISENSSLCDQCVALCCRYFAFQIETPKTHRDFEDLRWYLLHEDVLIFVEDSEWYIQINRKCRELLPDNRCGVYENRPTICREYTTKNCDWHADEYDYDHLFVEPDQIQVFGKQFLAEKRRRRARQVAKNGGKNGARKTSKASGKGPGVKRRRLLAKAAPLRRSA